MTAQVHDIIVWRSQAYQLVGVDGHGLFDPSEHGLETRPTTTANWRGWAARYAIADDRLILQDLHDVGIWVEPGQDPPRIGGVAPVSEGNGPATYPDLNLPVAFTGRLLFARGFIQSLYRHMGFHPAWKWEESWEVALDGGRVTDARDTSGEMRELRERIEAGELADPDDETRPGWIERTFRLDFWRSKGRSK